VVTLEKQDTNTTPPDPVDSSRILLAVSDDSNPNGTWYYTSMDSKLTINNSDSWADYPGFAVDEEAVYVTANMLAFGGGNTGQRLWIVAKEPFYSGGTATSNVYDPSTLAALPGYRTTQPAHMFGDAPGDLGTFLVQAAREYTDGTDALAVIRVDDPLGSPTFSNIFISLGDVHDSTVAWPGAPQLGTTTTIQSGNMANSALHAVWRDDALWATNMVVPPSGPDKGQTTAHWYKIDTSDLNAPTLADQGNVGGEDIVSGAHTYWPTIAVDDWGNMAMGFALSSSKNYAGAYYTGRRPFDAPGTVRKPGVLKAGEDYYVRTFGTGSNRWGDYAGLSVDPSDEVTFWAYNEYALPRGTAGSTGEDGRWGTAFGSFSFVKSARPDAVDLVPASDTGFKNNDNITNLDNSAANKKLQFSVTGTVSGAKVTVYGSYGTALGSAVATGSTTLVTTSGNSDLPDGPKVITARQTEPGKLLSNDSPGLSVNIDTAAPTGTVPDLDLASDTGKSNSDNITRGVTPTFTGTASDPVGNFKSGVWKVEVISSDGKMGMDKTAPFYSVTLPTLNEGTRSVRAKVYDVAGNSFTSGPLAVSVDRTAPTGTVPDLYAGSDTGMSNSDNITQGVNPQFDGSASDPSGAYKSGVWKVEVISTDGKTATDQTFPFYSATLATLNEGVWNVSAKVYDVAGNVFSTAVLSVTVDRTAAAVASLTPSPGAVLGSIANVLATFTEDVATVNATTFKLFKNGVQVPVAVSYNPATRTATFTPSATLTNGDYVVRLYDALADKAGNSLDGEYPGSAPGFPSGNGLAGGNFEATFTVGPSAARLGQAAKTRLRNLGLAGEIRTGTSAGAKGDLGPILITNTASETFAGFLPQTDSHEDGQAAALPVAKQPRAPHRDESRRQPHFTP